MVIMRKWMAAPTNIVMEAPFFDELIEIPANEKGRLNRDFEAHALWHYLGVAINAYRRAQVNLVEEEDLSLIFNKDVARRLFQSIANAHGVEPHRMVRYWDMIDRQRLALGGGSIDIPGEFKFKFWGH